MSVKVNKENVVEITLGVAAALLIMDLLASIFANHHTHFGLEGAEDMENFGGRGRARRQGRRKFRKAKHKAKLQHIRDKYADREDEMNDSYNDDDGGDDGGGDDGGGDE